MLSVHHRPVVAPGACMLLLLFALLVPVPGAVAGGLGQSLDSFASGSGNDIYLLAGAGLPLVEDGKNGLNHSLRALDAVGTTAILTEGLKYAVHERRPDRSDQQSFPSGHASAAFAIATVESHYHPRQSFAWYTGATLIAASRVGLHRHYIHDVLAGGLLGTGTALLELHSHRGFLLYPVIRPGSSFAGLAFEHRF